MINALSTGDSQPRTYTNALDTKGLTPAVTAATDLGPGPNDATSSGSNTSSPKQKLSIKRKLPIKLIVGVIVLVLFLIGGGAAYYLSELNQDVRQQASTGNYAQDFIDAVCSGAGPKPAGCPQTNSNNSGSGCFIAGTQVAMADGSSKNIEDVKVGDWVKSYDEASATVVDKPVLALQSPINTHLVTLTFSDGTVTTNSDYHSYYVKNKGWSAYVINKAVQVYGFPVQQLSIGDVVVSYGGNNQLKEATLLSLQPLLQPTQTYNLATVQDTHTFFANGKVVHNSVNKQSAGVGRDGGNQQCPAGQEPIPEAGGACGVPTTNASNTSDTKANPNDAVSNCGGPGQRTCTNTNTNSGCDTGTIKYNGGCVATGVTDSPQSNCYAGYCATSIGRKVPEDYKPGDNPEVDRILRDELGRAPIPGEIIGGTTALPSEIVTQQASGGNVTLKEEAKDTLAISRGDLSGCTNGTCQIGDYSVPQQFVVSNDDSNGANELLYVDYLVEKKIITQADAKNLINTTSFGKFLDTFTVSDQGKLGIGDNPDPTVLNTFSGLIRNSTECKNTDSAVKNLCSAVAASLERANPPADKNAGTGAFGLCKGVVCTNAAGGCIAIHMLPEKWPDGQVTVEKPIVTTGSVDAQKIANENCMHVQVDVLNGGNGSCVNGHINGDWSTLVGAVVVSPTNCTPAPTQVAKTTQTSITTTDGYTPPTGGTPTGGGSTPTPTPTVRPSTSPTATPSGTPVATATPTPTPTTTTVATPTPTPTITQTAALVGCGDACTQTSDCSNLNHICYQGACRLASNPASSSCVLPAAGSATQPQAGQPSLPQELPTSGSDTLGSIMKVGLGVLSFGALLLLFL